MSASHKHCDPTLNQFSHRSQLELTVSVTHPDIWVCVSRNFTQKPVNTFNQKQENKE
jgi:hypothetical protein